MAGNEKKLSTLDWRLPEGYLFHFRHAANRAYLEGHDIVPNVGGHGKVWWRIGRVVRGFFCLCALLLLLFAIYSAIWDAAPRTQTTSLRLERGSGGEDQLTYTYEVNGQSYQRTEGTGPTHKSVWDSGQGQETLRYLNFRPEQAHLDFRGQPFSWLNALAIELFVLSLAYAGHVMMKTQNKLQRLVEGCTHVLPGKIVQVLPGQGYRVAVYEALSPNSEPLRGTVQLGEAEQVKNDLVLGAGAAVLYSDPQTHGLL